MGQKFINLNLAALAQIDNGILALAFQKELEACLRDVDDRPGNKTARTITIQIKLIPVAGPDEADEKRIVATGMTMDTVIKSSVPERTSKTYSFGLTETKDAQGLPKPSAYMSMRSPTNVNQLYFADAAQEQEEDEPAEA